MTLLDILVRTPAWVYGLGMALAAFGFLQTHQRRVVLAAAVLPSIGLAILSVTGVAAAFRGNALVVVAWGLGAAAALALARNLPVWRGVRAEGRRIVMPASWLPLALMLGIFFLRWATGVALAVQPALAALLPFALGMAAAGGLVSGLFLARGWAAIDARQSALAVA